MLENTDNNESFTTNFTEKQPSSSISVFKRQNFFRTLREEILKIERLPLESSETLEKASFYGKIVDHLENEKLKAAVSANLQQESLIKRQELVFEAQNSKTFEVFSKNFLRKTLFLGKDWKLPEFLEESQENTAATKNCDFQGNLRGKCRICGVNLCAVYRGNASVLGVFAEKGFFSCENCGCPMSSHESLRNQPVFSATLANFLENRQYQPRHLNFEAIVAVFFCENRENRENRGENHGENHENRENRGENRENPPESEFFKLAEFLNYAGFAVLKRKSLDFPQLFARFLEKKLYSLRNSMEKTQYESLCFLLRNTEEFSRVFRENPLSQKTFVKSKLSARKNLIETQLRGQLFEETQFEQLRAAIHEKLQGKFSKSCISVLFSAKTRGNFSNLRDFMQSSQKPRGFELFYASKNPRNALLDCEIFFPEALKFNFLTFLLCPALRLAEKTSGVSQKLLQKEQDAFEDAALYNEFSLINSRNREHFISSEDFLYKGTQVFAKILKNHGSLLSLFNSEEGACLNVCGKFGSCVWTQPSADIAANFLKFSDSYHNQCIFKGFLPRLASYQRVLLVLRPNLLHSDVDELVLNVFRINDFTIIKRDFVKLSEQQAYYLAKIEKIPEESLDNYLRFMLNGPVELVLLSNFAAFALADVIIRGCSQKNRRKDPFLRDADFVLRKAANSNSREVLIKRYENPHEISKSFSPFAGIQQLFDPTQLILEETPRIYQEKVWVTESLNEAQSYYAETAKIRAPNFKKAHLLKEFAQDDFNYFAFSAEDETISEELTCLLLPDCSIIAIIQVILKPNAVSYANQVASTFAEMGFQVPYRKKVSLSARDAENFLLSLGEDAENREKLVNYWSSEEVEVFSLVKMACRKEVLSLLRSFSAEPARFTEKPQRVPLSKQFLAEMLVPCWTNSSFFWSLGVIDASLKDFSWENIEEIASFKDSRRNLDPSLHAFYENTYDFSNKAVKFQDSVEKTAEILGTVQQTAGIVVKTREMLNILEFILMNCFADSLAENSATEALIFQAAISEDTAKHVNFRVKGKRLGEFEVRLRKISREKPASELSRAEFEYKMIGWYYSLVNRSFPQRTPVSYHYKIHADSTNLQVFDCQQFVGLDFLREILRQMLDFQEKLHKKPQLNRSFAESPRNQANESSFLRNSSQLLRNSSKYADFRRGDIVAYLWGSKLAKFVKSLEKISEKIEGFGEIRLNSERKLAGLWRKEQLFSQEKELFQGILAQLSENLDDLYEVESVSLIRKPEEKARLLQRISELHARISSNLSTILCSESYKYLRKPENLRIFPQTLEPENLRIFCDREQIIEILLHGEFETLDFYHEINKDSSNSKKSLHFNDYCLAYVRPAVKSKYSLVAMVQYLLENSELFAERLANENFENLQAMSEGIQEGFRRSYFIDNTDLEFLQQMHKDTVVQASFIRKKVPDLIKLELFFYSLEQIEKNLKFLREIKQKLADSQLEKAQKIEEIQRKLAIASRDAVKELNQRKKILEKEFDKEFEARCGLLRSQTAKCRGLFEKLSNFSIFYNFEELLLREDENFLENAKVKVPQKKYFLPLLEEHWENDLENERFRKDLNEVFLRSEHGFEQYQGAVFFKNLDKDPLQQTWVQKRPFFVSNLREVPREEKDGVLVEKIRPNAEKMLQNAIDKEIAKFKEMQKGLLNTHGVAETGDSRSNTQSWTERDTNRR